MAKVEVVVGCCGADVGETATGAIVSAAVFALIGRGCIGVVVGVAGSDQKSPWPKDALMTFAGLTVPHCSLPL